MTLLKQKDDPGHCLAASYLLFSDSPSPLAMILLVQLVMRMMVNVLAGIRIAAIIGLI